MFPWACHARILLHSILACLVSGSATLFEMGAFEALEFLEHIEGVGAGELKISLIVASPIFACLFLIDTVANSLLV